MTRKKIFFLITPGTGHVNPACGLTNELCKESNMGCIFYGIAEHRKLIEKTGAQYRQIANRCFADVVPSKLNEKDKEPVFAQFFHLIIDAAYDILPQLINDFDTEKPDMIVCDTSFPIANYFLDILKTRNKEVQVVQFYPFFVFDPELKSQMPSLFQNNFRTLVAMGNVLLRQSKLSWTFGMSIYSPFNLFLETTPYPKIVAVFPELHPNIEKYDSTHHFVGQCVSEEARAFDWNSDLELKSFIDMFPPKLEGTNSQNEMKLILMALGSLFHRNTFVYELVIQAIREFNQKQSRHFDASKFKVIISVGEESHKNLSEKIEQKELILPDNILLRPKVPQLEILKQADLFITHCGMNSTIESIKYAVPIVAIPIEGDQHINAARVCDQLTLGIRLEPLKMKVDEIADSIDKVLSDEKYLKNIQELSKISSKYDGKIEGKRIILEILNQKNIISN